MDDEMLASDVLFRKLREGSETVRCSECGSDKMGLEIRFRRITLRCGWMDPETGLNKDGCGNVITLGGNGSKEEQDQVLARMAEIKKEGKW